MNLNNEETMISSKEYETILLKLDENNKLLHKILSIVDITNNNSMKISRNKNNKVEKNEMESNNDNNDNNDSYDNNYEENNEKNNEVKNKGNYSILRPSYLTSESSKVSSSFADTINNNSEDGNNKKKKTKNKSYYKEIKRESIQIDQNIVKRCLDNCNIQSDVDLFKIIYTDSTYKEYYPIRNIKKKYQYWLDNKMNDDDANGTYIKNVILKNIEELYLKINNYENYSTNIEQFLKNQEHIHVLMEEKYKDRFLAKIIETIVI
jgi:hypothetical protein